MKILILLVCLVNVPLYAASIRNSSHGIVFDTDTQLMWQDENITATDDWIVAISVCRNSTLGGFNDWRLPNINELLSLVDYSKFNPAHKTIGFQTGNLSGNYWSSTSDAEEQDYAWELEFNSGTPFTVIKKPGTKQYYVRCVRGG